MLKKISVLLLSSAMILTSLTACQSSELKPMNDSSSSLSSAAPADEQDDPETPAPTPEPKDYTYAYEKYSPDDVVLTVDGSDVTWKEYFYWVKYMASDIEQYVGSIDDWNDALELGGTEEEMTNAGFLKESVESQVQQFRVLEAKAEELGVSLDDEDKETLQQEWEAQVETEGKGDEKTYMKEEFIDRELFDSIMGVPLLFTKVYETMFGENGEDVSDEDAISYAAENGFLKAKHILLQTEYAEESADTADDSETADEPDVTESPEEQEAKEVELEAKKEAYAAEQRVIAENVLAQINAADDKAAKFEELLTEYNEDPGMESSPDGYTFAEGTMVTEFYEGTKALEEGEISDIIESDFGYHIIMRLPLTADSELMYRGQNVPAKYFASEFMMNSNFEAWMDESKIEYTDEFKDLDLADVLNEK